MIFFKEAESKENVRIEFKSPRKSVNKSGLFIKMEVVKS